MKSGCLLAHLGLFTGTMSSIRQFFLGRNIAAILLGVLGCFFAAPSAFAARPYSYPKQHLSKSQLQLGNFRSGYRLKRLDLLQPYSFGARGHFRGQHTRDPLHKGVHPYTRKAQDRRVVFRGKTW